MSSLNDPSREVFLYRLLGILAPPAATYRYAAAAHNCAAPIAIIWVAALMSIAYALVVGASGMLSHAAFPLVGGVFLWIVTAIWTFLVIRNIHTDPSQTDPEEHERRVRQHLDDHDPLENVERDTSPSGKSD